MKHFFILAILLSPLLHVMNSYGQRMTNDWENPGLVSQNTLAPHAWFIPYSSEQAAILHKNSERIHSLNGRWKFHLAQNPAARPEGFYKVGFNTGKWNSIIVPGHWQTQGFDKFIFTDVEYPIPPNPPFVPGNYNPVGSYKRNFTIPANWKEKRVILRFGAVNSFFYCWINGHYIGLSKDSKTPAEFDISTYIKKGMNSVAVQVFRFSDGTYLEGQDMWKLSGIERNVELIARPRNGIRDFFIKTGLDSSYTDGLFNITLALNNNAQSTDYAEISVLDELQHLKNVFYVKQKFNADSLFNAAGIVPNVRKWNAETPNIYTVLIVHKDKFGKTKEAFTQKIGFRSIEIKNGLFLVNGRAIKIKGVNRHEHDMVTGKVIEIPGMIRDIQLFKQYNINAMRCSHYPNREEWYELCLKYGIYVIDEVNLECDGMSFSPLQTLSDKPEWKAAYLDRTRRMFERDKNFSCIIGWSLGNESQWGENFIATYNYLKEQDKTRPVQYEPAEENPYTDLFVPMYKSIPVWEAYVAKHPVRPLILCEYAHMMGNSGGNFKDDWDLFYKYDQLQGGFIWDFADQTFKKKDKNGRTIWAYGRDMGKVGATSDTSFCADGMFHADRSPHPQAYEMKKVYQNIHFELLDPVTKTITVTNRFDFINLKPFLLQWQIKADGKTIAAGNLELPDIAPHDSTLIKIPVPDFVQKPGTAYFLNLVAITRNATELLPANFPIAREQFLLPATVQNISVKPEQKFPGLMKKENDQEIKIISATVTATINKKTGWLNQFNVQGVPIIKEALEPHFWRAATDNDIGNSHQITAAIWQHVTETATLDSLVIASTGTDSIVIRCVHSLPAVQAKYLTNYTFYKNGTIRVGIQMQAAPIAMPDLPRFGMRVILTKAFEKVSWLGRGPFDNYQDRNYAADIDLYTMPADSLFFPYARAQESGYRTDVRWMAMQNKQGLGIMAIGTKPISTGVLHFNMNKLEFDRNAAENNHGGSMTNEDLIWWNIDEQQMGVGGDNSWGAKTHTIYTLPYTNYSYEFLLKPLLNHNRLTEIAKEQ